MADNTSQLHTISIENYPWRIILIRWLLLAVEAGIGTFFVIRVRLELGILFMAYGVVCLFMLLPLLRCIHCAYYGKRCNMGWGQWVSTIFPKGEASGQGDYYGYTMLFWPLRALPILIGIYGLLQGALSKFLFIPQGLFGIYILVLFLHKRFYRAMACPRCLQAKDCPVIMGGNQA